MLVVRVVLESCGDTRSEVTGYWWGCGLVLGSPVSRFDGVQVPPLGVSASMCPGGQVYWRE